VLSSAARSSIPETGASQMLKRAALPYGSMTGLVAPGGKVIRLVAGGPLVARTVTESAPLTGRLGAVRLALAGWSWYQIAVQRIRYRPRLRLPARRGQFVCGSRLMPPCRDRRSSAEVRKAARRPNHRAPLFCSRGFGQIIRRRDRHPNRPSSQALLELPASRVFQPSTRLRLGAVGVVASPRGFAFVAATGHLRARRSNPHRVHCS
jgi:hypothetical protein